MMGWAGSISVRQHCHWFLTSWHRLTAYIVGNLLLDDMLVTNWKKKDISSWQLKQMMGVARDKNSKFSCWFALMRLWLEQSPSTFEERVGTNSNCRLVWQLLSISCFCLLKFVIRGVLLWTLQRHGPWLNDLGRLIPAKSRFNETGNHNFPIRIDELVALFRSIEAPTLLLFKH